MNAIVTILATAVIFAAAAFVSSSATPLIINLAPGERMRLTVEHIRMPSSVEKAATSTAAELWFELKTIAGDGAGWIVDARGMPQHRFNLAQLMKGQIYLSRSPKSTSGISAELSLVPATVKSGEESNDRWPITRFKILFKPIQLKMDTNTGIHLLHKSSQLVTSHNLSFSSNHPDLPVEYSIVDQPEHGVVECQQRGVHSNFQSCSSFAQSDIDAMRVRYRHTGVGRPDGDSFSLQVHSGGVNSIVYYVSVHFISVTVRVIMAEGLFLNNSNEAVITRKHMAASTFPRSFPPHQLIYHVVDPPKLGMLSRRLVPSEVGMSVRAKSRRIGVSSNFTQAHVDEGLVHYRLNFHHYSLKRDSFSFRLITPSAVSELLHFAIDYIPGANAINLWNRTLVVKEGGVKPIANNTLWLETPDEKNFRFSIAMPPLHGRVTLANDDGGKFYLTEPGSSFTSLDIAQRRLFYEHSGDESRSDRMLLVAESLYHARTGGANAASIPFKFTFSIMGDNDHPPQLLGGATVGTGSAKTPAPTNEVLLLKRSGVGGGGTAERTLYSSLFPWFDGDDSLLQEDSNNSTITTASPTNLLFHFPDIYRDFVIYRRESPDNPVHNFTMTDLRHGSLLIRQLSSKDEATARFTVSDGEHSTRANLLVRCSYTPELKLVTGSQIDVPLGARVSRYLLVTPHHLSATTNADMDLDEIRYELHTAQVTRSPFRLLLNGVMTPANSFPQRAIRTNLLFVAVDEFQQRSLPAFFNLSLRAKGFSNDTATIEFVRGRPVKAAPQTTILTLPRDGLVTLENSSSVLIDEDMLGVELYPNTDESASAEPKFLVLEPPRHGLLSLNVDSYGSLGGEVDRFKESDLTAGRLTYTYSGSGQQERADYVLLETVAPVKGLASHRVGPIKLTFRPKVDHVDEEGWPVGVDHRQLMGVELPKHTADLGAELPGIAIEPETAKGPAQLEANFRLNAAPGIPTVVGMDALRAKIPGVPAERTLFLLTTLPMYGKLYVEEAEHKMVDAFSQTDINARRLVYQSLSADLGAWTQHDSFKFVVVLGTVDSLNADRNNSRDIAETLKRRKKMAIREFKFRISISYSNVPSTQLDKFVSSTSTPLVVSAGGSVLLNSTHLNLTKLSHYCDDSLWIDVHTAPRSGILMRVGVRHVLPAKNFTNKDSISSSVLRATTKEGSNSAGEWEEDDENGEEYGVDGSTDVTVGMLFTAEEIHSGRALFYQHLGNHTDGGGEFTDADEFVLAVWPSRERHRNRLRLPIRVHVRRQSGQKTVVERFPERVQIVSGQSLSLSATDFHSSNPTVPPSQLTYRVIQLPSNGVRVRVTEERDASLPTGNSAHTPEFTQAQVNKGLVRLEHFPPPTSLNDGVDNDNSVDVDAMTLEIGGSETKVLMVAIEPLQLSLINSSAIEFLQGRTYVVLNRSHLGAKSNGGAAKIHYNITRPPQNGSLYWVDGEREANSFSQRDIDNGQLLYAQLNMASYMDSFDFVLSNEETELAETTARIRVLPAVRPIPLITQARTITRVALLYLNASLLEGAPRYVVVKAPNYGRLFLHPASNKSAHFFTQSDIRDGLLFFHAFDVVESRALDTVELELRSDNTQPARFDWLIDIRPFNVEGAASAVDGAMTVSSDGSGRRLLANDNLLLPDSQLLPPTPLIDESATRAAGTPPELNYHFPIVILAVVVLSVLTLLLCRKSRSSKMGKKSSTNTLDENDFAHKISMGHPLPDLDDVLDAGSKSSGNNAADLLDATVYGGSGGIGGKGHRRDASGRGVITTAPFALPSSKRPATVSAIVPTFATFDEPTSTNRGGTNAPGVGVRFGALHNGMPNNNNGNDGSGALRRPNRPAVSSEARQTMQTALLAAAAAARVAEKQREANGSSKVSSIGNANSANRDAIARLKQNQYWV